MGLQAKRERSSMWECYGGEDKDEPKQWDLFDHFCPALFQRERERERERELLHLISLLPYIWRWEGYWFMKLLNNRQQWKECARSAPGTFFEFLVEFPTRTRLLYNNSWINFNLFPQSLCVFLLPSKTFDLLWLYPISSISSYNHFHQVCKVQFDHEVYEISQYHPKKKINKLKIYWRTVVVLVSLHYI